MSIGGIYAYANGFEFYVHVRMRGNYENNAEVWGDPFGFGRHGPATGDGLRLPPANQPPQGSTGWPSAHVASPAHHNGVQAEADRAMPRQAEPTMPSILTDTRVSSLTSTVRPHGQITPQFMDLIIPALKDLRCGGDELPRHFAGAALLHHWEGA